MDLARILGTIVATRKVQDIHEVTLLVLQPVAEDLTPRGALIIATDSTGRRGVGELVYFVASGDATFTGPDGRDIPSDAAVIGIVDDLYVAREKPARS